MKILVILVVAVVVVKGYPDGRVQRSPQHRRPFRSHPSYHAAPSFKTRRSPPWDSLPPFMKAEMMMDAPQMILKSKPSLSLPPDFNIELPSILRDLPSIFRKPTIIIGDKIPIIHGSPIIIRGHPASGKAPAPVEMPAPAAMMAPAEMPAAPAIPEPAMKPEPPMGMPCSKPSLPFPGPWAEKTISLPPEFFMSDESNHLNSDIYGAGNPWDAAPISPSINPWSSMPEMPTMVDMPSTEAPTTEAPTTIPPPPPPPPTMVLTPQMTSPPVEAPKEEPEAKPAVPMMMTPEAMGLMMAPPRASKSNLIFQQSTLPETFNIVSLQHHQISSPFKLNLPNLPISAMSAPSAPMEMMSMPMMAAMMPAPAPTTAAPPVTMAPVEATTKAEIPAPGWQIGGLDAWKQMVSEPAKWSFILPEPRRSPPPIPSKNGNGWW